MIRNVERKWRMNSEIREKLEGVGVDVNDLMERLMGNMTLISRFFKRFPDDASYERMVAGIEKGDVEEAFRGAHSLKGVCANLSMKRFLTVLNPLVDKLREGRLDGVQVMLSSVDEEYRKVVTMIQDITWNG